MNTRCSLQKAERAVSNQSNKYHILRKIDSNTTPPEGALISIHAVALYGRIFPQINDTSRRNTKLPKSNVKS